MVTMTTAGPEDLLATLELLERCGLPQDGLTTSAALIVVTKDADAELGCAALEV
jgi:hypothetical protein